MNVRWQIGHVNIRFVADIELSEVVRDLCSAELEEPEEHLREDEDEPLAKWE